jgi:hypothetical protein
LIPVRPVYGFTFGWLDQLSVRVRFGEVRIDGITYVPRLVVKPWTRTTAASVAVEEIASAITAQSARPSLGEFDAR